MADDSNEGAAYLLSLKKPRAPAAVDAVYGRAAAAIARAEIPSVDARQPAKAKPGGAEKRRSPRYQCQGSVRLQPTGGAASTWATCTDISLNGCYVEASTPYAAGAELAVRVEANNLRVEGIGEVRVCYPGLGMGIAFIAMPEEDRERLLELVRSLARVSSGLRSARVPSLSSEMDAVQALDDPGAALRAMLQFFENRQMMSREVFQSILRKS